VGSGCAAQSYWAYQAFIRPRAELKEILSEPVPSAVAVAYENRLSFGGGNLAWTLKISASDAERLRARCEGPGSIVELNQTIVVVEGTKPVPPSHSGEKTGCIVADTESESKDSGATVVLADRQLQLTRWFN
jgi:hypothetical protein